MPWRYCNKNNKEMTRVRHEAPTELSSITPVKPQTMAKRLKLSSGSKSLTVLDEAAFDESEVTCGKGSLKAFIVPSQHRQSVSAPPTFPYKVARHAGGDRARTP